MSAAREVREGEVFGRLVVLDVLDEGTIDRWVRVRCARELGGCGLRKRVRLKHLVGGASKSCGCRSRGQQRRAA